LVGIYQALHLFLARCIVAAAVSEMRDIPGPLPEESIRKLANSRMQEFQKLTGDFPTEYQQVCFLLDSVIQFLNVHFPGHSGK